jgi:hypothetical protein
MPSELTENLENALDDLEEATASYYFASKAIHLIMGQNTNDIQDRHEKIARISKSPRSFSVKLYKRVIVQYL